MVSNLFYFNSYIYIYILSSYKDVKRLFEKKTTFTKILFYVLAYFPLWESSDLFWTGQNVDSPFVITKV